MVATDPPGMPSAARALGDRLPGSVWMLISAFLFTAMLAVFKALGDGVPVVEVLFLRQAMVLAVLLPGLLAGLPRSAATLRSRAPGLQLLRSGLSAIAMYAGFTAVVHLPLTQSTTLAFTRVIFAVLLSAILLGERVGRRRWAAVAVGFVGAIVVASPSPADPVNQYALLSILAALFTGSVTVILKRLSAIDPPRTIMVWQSVILLALLAFPAWVDWRWPTLHQWELIGVMGLLMAGTQWTSIQALRLSDASAMAPIEYTRLIWAALLGFAVFGHVPDAATMLGAALIIVAAVLAARSRDPATPIAETGRP